jgi:Na+/H+-translocating membrane pyrophosphatase
MFQYIFGAGVLALLFVVYLVLKILKQDAGSENMREIAKQ